MPLVWQVINMELSHIVSFILGGFISAIIFYPKKKELDLICVRQHVTLWWYTGVRFSQINKDLPPLTAEDVVLLSINPKINENFEIAAKDFIKAMEKNLK